MRNSERIQTRLKLVHFFSPVMHNFCFPLDCALKCQSTQFEHRLCWLRTRSLHLKPSSVWRVNSTSAVVELCCSFTTSCLELLLVCVGCLLAFLPSYLVCGATLCVGSLQALWYDDGWFVGVIVNILPPSARWWLMLLSERV